MDGVSGGRDGAPVVDGGGLTTATGALARGSCPAPAPEPPPAFPAFPALPGGVGPAARLARAAALDAWLAGLLPRVDGVALVAAGGLGRREQAPHSDLDLVLLHTGLSTIDEIATAVWYPVWDAKLALDHSVRTLPQALQVAADDVKAALGLLDARLVAGDRRLAEALHREVLRRWRAAARTVLPELRELTRRRWDAHGELAFLLEGELKQARGGLRDVGVLRAIGYSGAADAARPAVRAAHGWLLDARDALHLVRGRRTERLLAQDRAQVAAVLGLAGPDEAARRVSDAARTVAYAVDDAWRAVERWLAGPSRPRGRTRTPVARDVVAQDGEAVLARAAIGPHPDPSLALRVAAAAARGGLPVAHATLEWLAAFGPPLPRPWPVEARTALLTLLGCGDALVTTWEAADRYGLVTRWLPEWALVRSRPQHNPVHRFTVDRHLVETARLAARYAREVARPDLLALCALLHDIGKGLPGGDHSAAGAAVAAGIAGRIGLPEGDVSIVDKVVRLHLLLPETATRRDLADPATVAAVAAAVGDADTLALLYALARADAAATGPAAWSTWKGRLVAELVNRVGAVLRGAAAPPTPPAAAPAAGPLPAVRVEPDRVAVTAADRRGLLAAVAGCLALHRLDVVTADTSTVDAGTGPVATVACAVQPRYGGDVDAAALAHDLRRAATGELDVAGRLAARERSARYPHAGTAEAPRVIWHPATGATLLELRATDSAGLLHRVADALAGAGADVRAARISTLGGHAVDSFYLVGAWGDGAARSAVEAAVLAAVAPRV